MPTIDIFPMGQIDDFLAYRLACCLEERFLFKFQVQRTQPFPRFAYNNIKKQYFAPAILKKTKNIRSEGSGYAIGLVDVDIYGISNNFIIGETNVSDGVALVSLCRLKPDFYGHSSDDDVLFQRALKECIHELSHAMGLKHCYNRICVMHYSTNIFDIDKKRNLLCSECLRRMKEKVGHPQGKKADDTLS
ncbi:MAG: archaemetzincin family Zn-dependent metalloprotease [Armatimonadetes bacterium]|nr:archaemetzincin family Zn-dependent metalloprotease [Armatimonadota bacterium]